jgi:hypothetical protein
MQRIFIWNALFPYSPFWKTRDGKFAFFWAFLQFQSLEKIDPVLAAAMMNLLRKYKIEFDHSDNIAGWQKEYSSGVTVGDSPRSIGEGGSTNLNPIGTDKQNLEWDSSAGVFGVSYYKDVDHKQLKNRTRGKVYSDVAQLDSVWADEDFESP